MTDTTEPRAKASSMVDIGGYRLAVRAIGSGTPPVVFVSCLGGDQTVWDHVLAELPEGITAVTYDRPALGASDPLPREQRETPLTYGWVADQLRDLLDHAEVATPRVLVGHSIGGLIIEAYASRTPVDAAGLVFLDSTVIDLYREFDYYTGTMVDGDDDGGGIRFDHETSWFEHQAADPVPRVPSVVLTAAAGRWLRYTDVEQHRPFHNDMAELDRRWLQGQADLATRVRGVQAIAHTADHHLNREAPKLVAVAVDAAVRAARDGHVPHLDAQALASAGGYLPAGDDANRE